VDGFGGLVHGFSFFVFYLINQGADNRLGSSCINRDLLFEAVALPALVKLTVVVYGRVDLGYRGLWLLRRFPVGESNVPDG
jgi:hypothetical protein